MTSAATESASQSQTHLGLSLLLLMAMALPMLLLYAVGTLGPFLVNDLQLAPELLAWFTLSSFSLAAILSLLAGGLVSRWGMRRSMLILFACVGCAFTLLAALQDLWGLAAAAAICGVAQALANPVTNQIIASQVALERKAFVVGFKQSGVQVAALFSGLVLPSIALWLGWRVALVMVVPIALLLLIMTLWLVPITTNQAKKSLQIFIKPKAILLCLMATQFSVGLALSSYATFLPLFASQQGMSPALAGMLIALFGAMGIVSRLLLTPLSTRFTEESYLLMALVFIAALAVSVLLRVQPDQLWLLWLSVAGVGLSAVATIAISMGMLIKDPRFGPLAQTSGWVSAAFFLGLALGPSLFGLALASEGGFAIAWQWVVVSLVVSGGMAILLSLFRRSAAQVS